MDDATNHSVRAPHSPGRPPIDSVDRASIANRLGAHGDFVRVPQLARSLGISAKSIHAQMRRGAFPIPHRKVGAVIVVKVDDYIDWFWEAEPARPALAAPAVAIEPGVTPPSPVVSAIERASEEAIARLSAESPRERKERLRREVLEGMRRKGFKV